MMFNTRYYLSPWNHNPFGVIIIIIITNNKGAIILTILMPAPPLSYFHYPFIADNKAGRSVCSSTMAAKDDEIKEVEEEGKGSDYDGGGCGGSRNPAWRSMGNAPLQVRDEAIAGITILLPQRAAKQDMNDPCYENAKYQLHNQGALTTIMTTTTTITTAAGHYKCIQLTPSHRTREKQKVLDFLELAWNLVAIIFLVHMIQSRRYIPQHQDTGGEVGR